MSKGQIIGLIGSVLLIIGVFIPLVKEITGKTIAN